MQNQNKSHSTLVDEYKNRGAQARYIKPNTNCLKKNVSIGLQCKIKTKVIPRWWKNRSNRGSDVLDYAGFGTMQLRFAILTNCYTPFSSSQSGEANGESAARYIKPNTNCLKKNVSIGLQCKIKTKVIPRWWMSAKIEGR